MCSLKNKQWIVALILIAVLVGCSEKKPTLKPLPLGSVIIAFGDSLTYGTGASTPDKAYPAVLSQLLVGYTVINAGLPGEETAGGLKRLPGVLEKYQPKLVLLCLGGNDILRKIEDEKISDNLKKMIVLIKKSNAQVVLIAVPKPNLLLFPASFYEALGEEFKIPVLVDALPDLLNDGQYKSDSIHLNDKGYRLLAEKVASLLKETGAIQPINIENLLK